MWKHAFAFLLLVSVGTGCALVPPQKIPMDRRNYIDAVSTSWKEQLLTNLIKLRYGDSLTFLELTGINTNYTLDANVGVTYFTPWHFLWGTSGFRNSLTAGGTGIYRDSPNITYSPIRGEALAKTLMTPIPVGAVLKSLQTGWRTDFIIPCLVESINGRRNRSPGGTFPGDPEFFKIAQLLGELSLNGIIRISIEQVTQGVDVETTEEKECKTDQKKETTPKKKRIKQKKQEKKQPEMGGETKNAWKPKSRVIRDKKEFGDIVTISLVVDRKRAEMLDRQPDRSAKPSAELFRGVTPALLLKNKSEEVPANNDKKESYINKLIKIYTLLWPNKEAMKPDKIMSYMKYEIIDGNKKSVDWEKEPDKVVVQTRSVMEVLTMLSKFILVPDGHINNQASPSSLIRDEKNIQPLNANEYNIGENLIKEDDKLVFKIGNGFNRPADCFVAVKYGDYWFSIKNTDFISKEIFSWSGLFFSMSEPGTKEGTPTLTLPVQ
jgi:hypothetical protein